MNIRAGHAGCHLIQTDRHGIGSCLTAQMKPYNGICHNAAHGQTRKLIKIQVRNIWIFIPGDVTRQQITSVVIATGLTNRVYIGRINIIRLSVISSQLTGGDAGINGHGQYPIIAPDPGSICLNGQNQAAFDLGQGVADLFGGFSGGIYHIGCRD